VDIIFKFADDMTVSAPVKSKVFCNNGSVEHRELGKAKQNDFKLIKNMGDASDWWNF
jgi:hypothetical protein